MNIAVPPSRSRSERRTMLASTVGTVMEWYDFNLYGLASALIFGPLIFGSGSVSGVLASFATYAVGFAARPIGGVVLGNLGDRMGRKAVLMITFILMGLATTLVGLLPTWNQVGIWAPIMLIVLRVVQGFATGGEFAGATLLTIESAPPGKRGLYGAIPAMGTGAGFVLASGVFAGVAMLPEEAFLSWGWRIPFLVSIGLVVFGAWLRRGIDDTPVFNELGASGEKSRMPWLEVIRTQPGALIRVMGITISGFVFGYTVQAFSLNYGVQEIGYERTTMLWAIAFASAIEIIAIPFWGWLSDKIGRRLMVAIGLIFTCLYIFPFFWLLQSGEPVLVFVAMVLALPIAKDMVFGPQAALVAELFDARVRCTGVSTGREIGGAIFGGTAPFIATAIVAATGSIAGVAGYIIVACILTFIAVFAGKETAHDELRLERAGVADSDARSQD